MRPLPLGPLLLLVLTSCKDKGEPVDTATAGEDAPSHWEQVAELGQAARAITEMDDGALLVAADSGILRSSDGGETWAAVSASGLGEGEVTFLHSAGGDAALAWVYGDGLYRTADGGESWAPTSGAPSQPLMSALNPRGKVVPFGADVDDAGRLWLAGVGGLFYSDDSGDTFTLADTAGADAINVLFTDVATDGDQVLAVSQLANSILPSSYQGLLSGSVFYSDDRGASWELLDDGLDVPAAMGAAFLNGEPCIAAMGAGTLCRQDGAWTALGGPTDAVGISAVDGGLSVVSATRGAWRLTGARWSSTGGAAAVAGIDGHHAVGIGGEVWSLVSGAGGEETGDGAGGTVYIALSFHTNLYHSYRGDTNDEDGYGKDIRVIRTVLDWLDEHPDAHAEWDIENNFSLDGWLASEAPDIVTRLQDRVDAGQDDMRIMSWNNGAMASSTEEEFRVAVRRAQDSYDAVFSEQVPGVQPQECMFTPDHIGWYTDEGVDWITLFYSANGFTSVREDVEISGASLYNPVTLRDPATGDEMDWIPAYHHADVLGHGGLSAWASQISAQVEGDALLLIHFDADAESWENFGLELDSLTDQLASGQVAYTNIQTYLDSHPSVETVDFYGDVADGTGDGFQSWAEKDFNHRLATRIFQARERADAARALAGDVPAVEALLEAAIEPRLVALSTTHFGLAAPYLADDRVEAAWGYADAAYDAADAAFALASAEVPVSPGTLHVLNHRSSSGTALIEAVLPVSGEDWTSADAVAIYDEDGDELPIVVDTPTGEGVPVSFALALAAGASRTLTWTASATGDRAEGAVSTDLAPVGDRLLTECGGEAWSGSVADWTAETDARSVRQTLSGQATVALCGEDGTVTHSHQRYEGLPGQVVAVEAALPEVSDPEDAESVALSLFACGGHAEAIRWQAFSGGERSRPMRPGVETWNGQSADGWAAVDCADGETIQLAHRVTERSSLAFLPVRDRGGETVIAPLGTLWGTSPWHDARRTGGSGLGDVVTTLVGSQYRPAAPDWSGQTVRYRLLVGDGTIDAGTLDLFAHPPLVRVE